MAKQVLIALDQLINTLIGGGWADETISARAYRNSMKGIAHWRRTMQVIDGIFFWQPDHCKGSYLMEQERLHMPPAYREVYNKGGTDGSA